MQDYIVMKSANQFNYVCSQCALGLCGNYRPSSVIVRRGIYRLNNDEYFVLKNKFLHTSVIFKTIQYIPNYRAYAYLNYIL